MTESEHAQVLVSARFLRAAQSVDWLSMGLTLIAAFNFEVVGVILGLIAKLFAFRIAFDAGLLEDIASDRLTTSAFDDAALSLGLMPQRKTSRPWDARCRGAMRLVWVFAMVVAAQVVALVVRTFV